MPFAPPHRRATPRLDPLEPRQLLTVTVPAGFAVSTLVSGLGIPTAATFAPDGRLFVTQKSGAVRIVKDGQLLDSPALTLTVDTDKERGLLGLALDPAFSTNGFLYLYYTVPSAPNENIFFAHNRISRFTVTGNTASPDSELDLVDLPNLDTSDLIGGGMHFGIDGKLYVASGVNGDPSNAPSLNTTLGKILRLNPDGSVPSDNPFISQTDGINQYIYARGLRNPFTFAIQPHTGLTYLNDVGLDTYEEVDELAPGADYGWPSTEGPAKAAGITSPIYTYKHPANDTGGIAIVGGDFLPDGGYYFGDFSLGFIRRLDVATHKITTFATGLPAISGMIAGPDNSLYVIGYDDAPKGSILKISGPFAPATNTPPIPILTGPAASFQYTAGKTIKFTLGAKDKQDKSFPPSAFSFSIERIVAGGTPELLATGRNTRVLNFTIPDTTAALGSDVRYRFSLTAIDAAGASATLARTISPLLRTLTIKPSLPKNIALPSGTALTLDGTAVAPGTFTLVAGVHHTLSVPTSLLSGGIAYLFAGFSGLLKGTMPELDFAAPTTTGTLLVKYVLPIR